jgi:hypothetical protein
MGLRGSSVMDRTGMVTTFEALPEMLPRCVGKESDGRDVEDIRPEGSSAEGLKFGGSGCESIGLEDTCDGIMARGRCEGMSPGGLGADGIKPGRRDTEGRNAVSVDSEATKSASTPW